MCMAASNSAVVVFDFDHTFVDGNTDVWITKVRPELVLKRRENDCWTEHMGYIFEQLHQSGCSREELIEFVTQLVPFPGLDVALEQITASGSKAIIISDSNSVFIDAILRKQGLRHHFSDVITNPAHFDDSGQLRIQRCHSHSCLRCSRSPNMCKGTLLTEYLSAHGPHSHVIYVGDGEGDICPALTLRSQDIVLARKGYRLAEALSSACATLKAYLHVIDFESSLGAFFQDHFCTTYTS